MNLESKLLDGPRAGYCSSSEEEDNGGFKVVNDEDDHQANVMRQFAGSNTGPKGVLQDYQALKEQEKMKRMARDRAILKEAERGMLQGKKEDRERAQMEEEEEGDEDDLEMLRRKRMAEMRMAAAGRMLEVQDKNQFLSLTDGSVAGLLAVLIYEPGREDCEKMTHLCKLLGASYPKVKFARATATTLGMTAQYIEKALPTLQFYFRGTLVGNFLRISDELGLDCSMQKMTSFLKKNKINLNLNMLTSDSEISSDDE